MEWQPIETFPKDGTAVMVWNGSSRALAWWKEYYDGSVAIQRQNLVGEPVGIGILDPETHWMPLPSPPEQE